MRPIGRGLSPLEWRIVSSHTKKGFSAEPFRLGRAGPSSPAQPVVHARTPRPWPAQPQHTCVPRRRLHLKRTLERKDRGAAGTRDVRGGGSALCSPGRQKDARPGSATPSRAPVRPLPFAPQVPPAAPRAGQPRAARPEGPGPETVRGGWAVVGQVGSSSGVVCQMDQHSSRSAEAAPGRFSKWAVEIAARSSSRLWR